MQVNSITSFNYGRAAIKAREQEPAPAPAPQEPAQEGSKIYFGARKKDNSDKATAKAMRNTIMAFIIPAATAGALAGCDKDAEAYAYAETHGSATASASASDTCYHKDTTYRDTIRDTVYVDTIPRDTIPEDTIVPPEFTFERPLPLDTLAKHMYIWDIEGLNDTTVNGNRNIIHYHYARPWEYNNEVDANMNIKESKQDKRILVHDTEVKDYKGNHLYYGKEVREVPKYPITLKTYSGKTITTNALMTLESRRNDGDQKGASLRNTSLDYKLALMTIGDTVLVFKQNRDGIYYQDGKMAKGYLDNNTILLQDLIGEYSTDDHLTDIKLKAIKDEELKELFRKEEE